MAMKLTLKKNPYCSNTVKVRRNCKNEILTIESFLIFPHLSHASRLLSHFKQKPMLAP